MTTQREQKIKALCKYLLLLAGSAILAFGLFNVHKQSHITEGGVLGMTLLINHWFGISPAISGFIMDVTCYLIGYKYLGKQFAKYSIVASCGFAFFYSVFERIGPILPSFRDMPLTAAVVGGILVGLGVGLVVMVGGASGGDDALALVISHLTKKNISKAYLATDLVVLLLSLSYIPLSKIFFSLITVIISSLLIGFVQKMGKEKKPAAQDA